MESIKSKNFNKINFMESITSKNKINLNIKENLGTRNIRNINLIVRIKFKNKISGIIYDKEDDIVLYQRETIEQAFNRYITKKGINTIKDKPNNFYLIRGKNYILLDKRAKIMDLGINFGDKIEVQTSDDILETNAEFIYQIKKSCINNDILKKEEKKKCSLKCKIIIGLFIFILASAIIAVCLLFLLKKKPKWKYESFVTGLTYKENQIMRFQNIKTTKIFFDFGNINEANSTKTLKEYFDFVIGITNKDKIIENNIAKEIFQGFIFLENYMLDNETSKMLLQNSSLFDNIWKKRNLKNEKKYFNFNLDEINSYGCIDNGTKPIMKFIFYRNGNIKKIIRPKNLTTLLYKSMINVLEKVIPKISEDYFNKSYHDISEAVEKEYDKIRNNTLEEENEDEEEESNVEIDSEDIYEKEKEIEKVDNRRRNRILMEKSKQKKI